MEDRKIVLQEKTYGDLSEISDQEGLGVSELGNQVISDFVDAYREMDDEEQNGEGLDKDAEGDSEEDEWEEEDAEDED